MKRLPPVHKHYHLMVIEDSHPRGFWWLVASHNWNHVRGPKRGIPFTHKDSAVHYAKEILNSPTGISYRLSTFITDVPPHLQGLVS